jgi:hypothetical protein
MRQHVPTDQFGKYRTRSSASLPKSYGRIGPYVPADLSCGRAVVLHRRRTCSSPRIHSGQGVSLPILTSLPMNFMHTALIRPVLWFWRQAGAHRIFPYILPFLAITLRTPQTMMKSATLKFADDDVRIPVGRQGLGADAHAAVRPSRFCGRAVVFHCRIFMDTCQPVPAFPNFCKSILPKPNPALDAEFQIVRCAEQMQVIRH